MNQLARETAEIEKVAAEYRANGYTVTTRPDSTTRPSWLHQFEPDLIAVGEHESVIIEVKTTESLRAAAGLRQLADTVAREPGWRLEVVMISTMRAAEPQVSAGSLIPAAQVLETIDAAQGLVENGYLEPAFLAAWTAFESAYRHALARDGVDPGVQPANAAFKTLLSLGYLTGEADVAHLRALWDVRNRLVHGYASETRPEAESIGFLSQLAERLIEHQDITRARKDPRIDRDFAAPVGDFFDAVKEAERARRLAMWGLQDLSISKVDPDRPRSDPQSIAAAERAALAQADLSNEHPFLNAMTLVALYSALDALVEDLAPEVFKLQLRIRSSEMIRRVAEEHTAEWEQLTQDQRRAMEEAVFSVLSQQVAPPRFGRVRGEGTARYEAILATVGLDAPADRSIPQDMDQALAEFSALRDVIVHRGSRVDERALQLAPSLNYQVGQLVRLTRSDYRRYAAAIRTYGMEISRRLVGPNVFDLDLTKWRLNHIVND
jgi:hypothetical protein